MKPPKPPKPAVEGLDKLITTLTARLQDAIDDPDSSLKQTVNLATEIRKLEALKRKETAAITAAHVVAWLRQQPAEEKARIRRELDAMERRGGVLG